MADEAGQKTIQNLTAKRLRIRGDGDRVLVLPPFEKERVLADQDIKVFPRLDRLEMQNFIKVLGEKAAVDWELQLKMLLMGAAVGTGAIAYLVYQLLTQGGKAPLDPTRSLWFRIGTVALFILAMAIGILLLYLGARGERGGVLQKINRWIAQALSLVIILVVAMVLPLVAYYLFGGGRELLGGQNSLAKLGRSLQLIFIFTASLFPALLYFLFDRQQLGTLRQRFEHQIFRLDPNIQSLCDVRAKYGRQIDEIYGREAATGEGRLTRGTRWPILVATLVITVGWMLTLLPSSPGPEMTNPSQLLDFFMPQRSIVTFGFLGAYFFVLNTVLHRYVRADLKPKAYSSITVRVLVVIVLTWVIGLPFGSNNPYLLMLVFLIGVFPESGLTLIRESIRNQTGMGRLVGLIGSPTKEKYPLTELEELDVYDRARLLDEGVTNIESLAHHDLIDLMLETRIPVPRLVDWLDQAVLYLHLQLDKGEEIDEGILTRVEPKNHDNENEGKAAKDKQKKDDQSEVNREAVESLQSLRIWLRSNCVRTATDFMVAYQEGEKSLRIKAESEHRQTELDILFETLSDDEWLDYVRHWRKSTTVEEQTLDASSVGLEPSQVNVQLKALNGQDKTYEASFSIDEGMVDSLAPAAELEKLGIEPVGKTAFALSDGTIKEYRFALAQLAFMGEITAGRIIFGPDDAKPSLGVTALESVGITIDPANRTLTRLPAIPLK